MGRIAVFILALFVLTSFTGPGDPPEVGISFKSYWAAKTAIAGYTKINARYEWVAGAFDSGLHVPQYNGVPSGRRSGVWNADGAIAADTANNKLYLYSGGAWNQVGSTYTFTNGLTESGGTVKLGGTLVDATTTIDGGDAATLSFVDLSQLDINGRYSSFVFDSININSNNIKIDTLNYTLSTTGKKIMLRDTATGLVQNIDPALLGGSTAISSLTAATGNSNIDNGNTQILWNWNTLTQNTGLVLKSNSTTAASAQTLLAGVLQGANASSNIVSFTASLSNQHTGTNSTNTALYLNAENGTNNYALIVPSGGGSVGIGTPTPASILHTVGTVRHASLGTASGDTTTYKPLGISSAGDVFPMTYWPGGGGGGWGTTGTVATLTGASTLAMGTNNFTFASTGDANLMKIDAVNDRINISNSGIALGVLTVGGNTWINGSYLAVNDGSNQSTLGSTYLSLYNSFGTPEIRNASGHFQISPIAGYSTVINDNGVDADFRVEGDNDANLIFADAGNDKVGIGTASPTTKLHVAGRFAATQGADVASAAGAITLGTDGNTFEITGTAAITLISNAGWVNGSEINLIFTSTATLTDGTANSGTDIGMELAGNANFTASADDVLTLVLCEIGGVQRWREKSRSVN